MTENRIIHLPKGHVLYNKGEECDTMFVLRSGKSFPAAYLPDEGDILVNGIFLCTSITQPSMAFSRRGVPYWHNFAFTLREVKPHD